MARFDSFKHEPVDESVVIVNNYIEARRRGQQLREQELARQTGSQTIERRVKNVISEQLGINSDIANCSSFVDDLGADSLDVVELVMGLEEEFELEISDEEAERIVNVQLAIEYINTNY